MEMMKMKEVWKSDLLEWWRWDRAGEREREKGKEMNKEMKINNFLIWVESYSDSLGVNSQNI